MGTPAASAIDRGPGKLILTPTNMASQATNYGGTVLGATRAHELDFLDDIIPVPLEEFGGHIGEAIEGMQAVAFHALLRSFDTDALAALFPATATGSSTGTKVINGTAQGSIRSGHLRSARAVKLLFAPDNPTKRGILIYKALPFISPGDRARYTILGETTIGMTWLSIPDTANSGRVYQVSRVADMAV